MGDKRLRNYNINDNVNPSKGNLRWLMYSNSGKPFPYWLFIEEKPGIFLSLRVQERWPESGKKIFCKLEGTVSVDDLPERELVEECNIISQKRYGKKLAIILDRKIKKRQDLRERQWENFSARI